MARARTDSAFESRQMNGLELITREHVEALKEHIDALKISVAIQSQRADCMEKLAKNALNIAQKMCKKSRSTVKTTLGNVVRYSDYIIIINARKEFVNECTIREDEAAEVATAIALCALERCGYEENIQKNPEEEFDRIKKLFQKLGLTCT